MSGRFRAPIYVFFFALFPVLALLSANLYQMAVVEGLRAAVIFLAAAGGLVLFIGLWTGEWHRGCLVVSIFLLGFLSHGHIYKLFLSMTGVENTDATYAAAAITSLTLLTILILLAWFWVKRPERLAQNLNIVSLAMLLLSVFDLIYFMIGGRASAVSPATTLDIPDVAYSTSYRPDIYYIILDGYAREDVLSAVFELDNSPLINNLEQRGFYAAQNSHTNYIGTTPSLASSLNLQYLDDVVQEVGVESTNLSPLSDMIENNQVQYILDRLNYETITISSGYVNTEARRADRYLTSSFRGINQFETLLLQHTPVGRYFVLPGYLLPDGLQYDPHRDRIRFSFDALNRVAAETGPPKFVFAHIVSPHPPFVFGPNGEAIQPDHPYTINDGSHYPGTAEEYIEGYRNQLTYINKLLLETVDQILDRSNATPVIIIQSDHGSGAYLQWDSPDSNTCLKERASNFTAILTPDSRAQFYDAITPVNIFRILFNSYFETDFERLPDKTFFVPPTRPYDFREITSEIDSSDACFIR